MSDRSSPRKLFAPGSRVLVILAVCLITLIGALFRLYRITNQSLWFDEAFAADLAGKSSYFILTGVEPGHLPLYFLGLHYWIRLAGASELALRFFSALFGILTVPALYALGRRLLGFRSGLLMAALAAFSPFLVYYSQETRMYILLPLEGALLVLFLLWGIDQRRWAWALFSLTSIASLYTHYFALPFLFALAILAPILIWARNREGIAQATRLGGRLSSFLPWLGAELVAALAFLPWVIVRAFVFEGYISAAFASLTLESIFLKSWLTFALGHSVEPFVADAANARYAPAHALALWLGAGFCVIALGALFHLLRGTDSNRARWAFFAAVWLFVVTIILVYAVSVGRREFTGRYLATAYPAFAILTTIGISGFWRLRRFAGVLAAVFVFGAMGYSLVNLYTDEYYWRDDFRSTARYLAEEKRDGLTVICNANYSALALDYYRVRPGNPPCVGLPAESPPERGATERRIDEILKQSDYVYLSLWQDYYSDPGQLVEHYLDSKAKVVSEERFHGGIRVKGYATRPPIVAASQVENPLPAESSALGEVGGDRVRLRGYSLQMLPTTGKLRLTLYWQAWNDQPLATDYAVFVHLLGADGEKVGQDDSDPARGAYKTSGWRAGEIVADEHTLTLPTGFDLGRASFAVGLYDRATGKRLGSSERDFIAIAPLAR